MRPAFARLNDSQSHCGDCKLSSAPTPYDRIGGAEGVSALVDRFYEEMESAPEARGIRALHAADLDPVKVVLQSYLGDWLGGPPLYSLDRGHPRLRMRHLRFPIGEAERDAWLICMRAAMTATIADGALRRRLDADFSRLADHMRNQAPGLP